MEFSTRRIDRRSLCNNVKRNGHGGNIAQTGLSNLSERCPHKLKVIHVYCVAQFSGFAMTSICHRSCRNQRKNRGCLVVHRKLFHPVAICETASTWINDAAFAFSILEEVHAEDWMGHVSYNHVMGTRLAEEDESRISAVRRRCPFAVDKLCSVRQGERFSFEVGGMTETAEPQSTKKPSTKSSRLL